MNILLHCLDQAPRWHPRYRDAFFRGFKAHGLDVGWTPADRVEDADRDKAHVLFGPNYWRGTQDDCDYMGTESDHKQPVHYLAVDRCSVGNINDFVTIGWDGWGGHGTYPTRQCGEPFALRAEKWKLLLPEQIVSTQDGSTSIIIGEYPSACDDEVERKNWERNVIDWCLKEGRVPYYRPHPAYPRIPKGAVQTVKDPEQFGVIHTYKSSFGVTCALRGLPVEAHEASLAYMGDPDQHGSVEAWREWLLFTQWHISEIESGEFWEYLENA